MNSDDRSMIGRAITVIDAVAAASGPVSLAQLTLKTGLPKPTVRRIALDLVRHSVLESTAEGYRLGPRLNYYGFRVARGDRLAAAAQPFLRDLSLRTHGEVSWCGTFLGGELVCGQPVFGHEYLETVARHTWPTSALLGSSIVLTAGGRLQVAFDAEQADRIVDHGCRPLTRHSTTAPAQLSTQLDAARDTGFAYEREQVMPGWSCAAAVIRDAEERPLGVIGLTGRSSAAGQRSVQRALITAADSIARELRSPTPGRIPPELPQSATDSFNGFPRWTN